VPVPPQTVRFVAGGDSRDDSGHVMPWALREAKARGASAFLYLGDMELTPQLDCHFRSELSLLGDIPFYPVLGNHEVKVLGAFSIGQGHAEEVFRKNFLGTARTPVKSSLPNKIVYSVDLPGGVHFVALDNVSQAGFGADQMSWLAEDLDRAHSDPAIHHTIVGMHKPLAHNGVSTHGMDKDGAGAVADSDAAVALFVKDGVDLVLASHVHGFAKFTQSGIASYITGGLGAPITMSGPEHAFHHFLVLDVRPGAIDVDVVRFDGTPNMGTDEIED
jgi:calcineurin-like phosphoesterase family protein